MVVVVVVGDVSTETGATVVDFLATMSLTLSPEVGELAGCLIWGPFTLSPAVTWILLTSGTDVVAVVVGVVLAEVGMVYA